MIIDSENCNSCSDPKYFKITNLFNELKTEIEKADARYNLGIPDDFQLKWGNITGYIENQKDLTNYLNNFIIIYRNELQHDFEFIQQKLENKIQDEINLMKDDRLVIEGLIQRFINFQDTIDDTINQEKQKVQFLSEQRYSYVTQYFMNKNTNEEIKCTKIKISSQLINRSKIYSITLRISNNLSLLNLEKTYLHIKDNNGNTIGVSLNGVKQTLNYGKYVTWFFDNVYNIPNDINLSLHTTNIFGGSNESNLVRMIIYGNRSYLTNGISVSDENDIVQSNWTPVLGINVVNISEIYPQIKSLQKYRMAYATSELPDISTTGHKANIKEIRINQNIMGISLVNSISIMVASDYAYSGELNLKVHDINENLISTSNNRINLSQNLGKYVTWYFEPFQLKEDTIYKFTAWDNSGNKQVMRIHVASGKNEGITCFDQNDSQHTDYCPAFGINISSIFANNLYKSIKEVNIALGNEIINLTNRFNDLNSQLIEEIIHPLSYDYYVNEESELQIGQNLTWYYDVGRGNYSIEYLEKGQTIMSTGPILTYNSPDYLTVEAIPDENGICTFTNPGNSRTEVFISINTISRNIGKILQPIYSNIASLNSNKVDKVSGKGLSTNDYTTAEKTKLAGIETGANKTVVDTTLSTTSTNPVQNKVVSTKLDTKVDKVTGKGLSTNDYTNAEKNLVATVPDKANKTYVDTQLSSKVTKTYVDTQLQSINNNITKLEKNKADESSIIPNIEGYLSENKESIHVIADNVEDRNYEKTQATINEELTNNLERLTSSINTQITKINSELQGKTYTEWVDFNLYKNLGRFEDYSMNNYHSINDSSSQEYRNAALINLSSQTKLILNYLNHRFIIAEKSGANGCIPRASFTPTFQDPITLPSGQYYILGFPQVGVSTPPYGSYMTLSGNNLFAQIQNNLNILELRITSLENKVNNIINQQ